MRKEVARSLYASSGRLLEKGEIDGRWVCESTA